MLWTASPSGASPSATVSASSPSRSCASSPGRGSSAASSDGSSAAFSATGVDAAGTAATGSILPRRSFSNESPNLSNARNATTEESTTTATITAHLPSEIRLSGSASAAAAGGGTEGTETRSSGSGGRPEYEPSWGEGWNTPAGPSGAGGCDISPSESREPLSGCSASASGAKSTGAFCGTAPAGASGGEGGEGGEDTTAGISDSVVEVRESTNGGIDENDDREGGPECRRSCNKAMSSGTVASGRHSSKPSRQTSVYSLTALASILCAISSRRMGPTGTSLIETCHSGTSAAPAVRATGTGSAKPGWCPASAAPAAAGADDNLRDAEDARRGGIDELRRRIGEDGRRARAVGASCPNGETGSDLRVTSSKPYAAPAGTVTSGSPLRPSMRILWLHLRHGKRTTRPRTFSSEILYLA